MVHFPGLEPTLSLVLGEERVKSVGPGARQVVSSLGSTSFRANYECLCTSIPSLENGQVTVTSDFCFTPHDVNKDFSTSLTCTHVDVFSLHADYPCDIPGFYVLALLPIPTTHLHVWNINTYYVLFVKIEHMPLEVYEKTHSARYF